MAFTQELSSLWIIFAGVRCILLLGSRREGGAADGAELEDLYKFRGAYSVCCLSMEEYSSCICSSVRIPSVKYDWNSSKDSFPSSERRCEPMKVACHHILKCVLTFMKMLFIILNNRTIISNLILLLI